MSRIIALDVGRVRIGIALSDALKTIASPYESYTRVNIEKDILYISELIKSKSVDTVVAGLPISMDGKENAQCESIRFFTDRLAEKISLPIIFIDERFTTMSAKRILLEADVRRDRRKGVIDMVAASYILQNYLDKIKK